MIDGLAVGIVANQPAVLAGVLDIHSSIKGARFGRFRSRSRLWSGLILCLVQKASGLQERNRLFGDFIVVEQSRVICLDDYEVFHAHQLGGLDRYEPIVVP